VTERPKLAEDRKMKRKPDRDVDFVRMTKAASEGYLLLEDESDRGSVLVGGAMLEETLGAVLRAFLAHDDGIAKSLLQVPNAPLSTFSSRIRIARVLNLVSESLFKDLDRIRSIRNAAAHFDRKGPKGFSFSFADLDIAQRCLALHTIPEEFRKIFPPRTLFEMFVSVVSTFFSQYALAGQKLSASKDQAEVVRILLRGMPTTDYSKHLGWLADEILMRLAADVKRGKRPKAVEADGRPQTAARSLTARRSADRRGQTHGSS